MKERKKKIREKSKNLIEQKLFKIFQPHVFLLVISEVYERFFLITFINDLFPGTFDRLLKSTKNNTKNDSSEQIEQIEKEFLVLLIVC